MVLAIAGGRGEEQSLPGLLVHPPSIYRIALRTKQTPVPPGDPVPAVCSLCCSEVLQVQGVQIASYGSGEIFRHENQN